MRAFRPDGKANVLTLERISPPDRAPFRDPSSWHDPTVTRDAVAALLQRRPRPTAFLAMSETIAPAAHAALVGHGIAVPNDG
jgi:DNA-binding LacI/PurR family transcriptional regulator